MKYQLIVIGGGPAGLAAAYSAWERGLRSILVIERERYLGGILNQCIHNGFGLHYFGQELTGPEYAGRFVSLVQGTGIEILRDTTVLDLSRDREVHTVSAQGGYRVFRADAVILAMGCRERSRGAVGIPGTRPAGVFTAGTAQMYMNIMGYCVGKRVVIRGTGDIGLIMARRLTLEGAEVLACIGAGDRADGLERNVTQCLRDFNIPLLLRHTVTEVRGRERVEQVVAMEVDAKRNAIPGTEKVFDCDTLLLSVGLIPENELTKSAGIALDGHTGGAIVYENMETLAPGVLACGNVLQVHDLVDFVTEESIRAGAAAAEFVERGEADAAGALAVKNGEAVGYTVPMLIRREGPEKTVPVSFRVRKVFGEGSAVVVSQGEKVIARYKRSAMVPSEMQRIDLPRALIRDLDPQGGPLSVSAVSGEEESEK